MTPANATISYVWRANGAVVSTHSSTYVPTAGTLSRKITVSVSASAPDYVTAAVESSAPTRSVIHGVITPHSVFVTGIYHQGQTVRAVTSTWTPAPVSVRYEWFRGAVKIKGATRSSYKLTSKDRGHRVRVKIIGTKAGFTTVKVESAKLGRVGLPLVGSAQPTISDAAPSVGETVTVAHGTWHPSGVAFTYQWYVGGAAVARATGTSFAVTEADAGKTIIVRVTGTKKHYSRITRASAVTAPVVDSSSVL